MTLTLQAITTSAIFTVENDATLGRENTTVVIEHHTISRAHARVVHEHGQWFVEDMGSKHGTYLDGQKLSTRTLLRAGAVLRLGLFELRVGTLGAQAQANHLLTRELDPESLLPSARPPLSPETLSALLFEAQTSLYPLQDQVSLCRAALELIMTHVPATRGTAQMVVGDACAPIVSIDHLARVIDAFDLSSTVRSKVVTERKVLWIRDRKHSELAAQQSLVLSGVTSTIAAPVFEGATIFGLLYIDVIDGEQELSEGDASIVTIVASLLGIALSCSRVVNALSQEIEALKATR